MPRGGEGWGGLWAPASASREAFMEGVKEQGDQLPPEPPASPRKPTRHSLWGTARGRAPGGCVPAFFLGLLPSPSLTLPGGAAVPASQAPQAREGQAWGLWALLPVPPSLPCRVACLPPETVY